MSCNTALYNASNKPILASLLPVLRFAPCKLHCNDANSEPTGTIFSQKEEGHITARRKQFCHCATTAGRGSVLPGLYP